MRNIPDKDMAEICDAIENRMADALAPLYNHLARKYNFKYTTAEDMYNTGIDGDKLQEMRELAIQLFYQLGMDIQGDGKGF